jgi:regulatory protein
LAATALDTALRLLARRPHFRAELERKLSQRGYPEEEIAEALARVAELGYLDDLGLARAEVGRLRARRGLSGAAVAAELGRKGVDAEVVAAALAGAGSEADADAADLATAREVARRWLASHASDRAALGRHLSRKGHPARVIFRVLNELVPDEGSVAPDTEPD